MGHKHRVVILNLMNKTHKIYAYADTEMKRAAIEKATDANHPLRKAKDVVQENYDELTIKTLYGLC